MAFNLNSVSLAGNLVRDPESRDLSSGSKVCNFSLAIHRKYRDKEETTYIDVECWGKTAENCAQYLKKGRGVYLDGRLKQDRWEDRNGNKRSKIVVVAQNVQFLPRPEMRDEIDRRNYDNPKPEF